ncbi:MAG: 4Fe-4S dicluster domain-containing protein [bacterium]
MSLILHQKDLTKLIAELSEKWPVFGPVKDKNSSDVIYKQISSSKNLSLNNSSSMIPPKKFVFPGKEVVFSFERNKLKERRDKEIIVLGVNRKDAEGLFYLDKTMTTPLLDETYFEKRKNVKLVVIDSLAPSNNINCDLYLQRVDKNNYFVFPYGSFGEKIIKSKLFSHKGDVGTISTRHMPDEITHHPRLDEIVENSREHPVWDRLAETCFNCGICSYVCPLCYCFETEDNFEITKDIEKDCSGCRNRKWDSCMLPDFDKVTFHNFRPKTKDRIYNWYYHKFVRMSREYGFPGCIDCGRCITYCPAKINYREVLKELIKDERK